MVVRLVIPHRRFAPQTRPMTLSHFLFSLYGNTSNVGSPPLSEICLLACLLIYCRSYSFVIFRLVIPRYSVFRQTPTSLGTLPSSTPLPSLRLVLRCRTRLRNGSSPNSVVSFSCTECTRITVPAPDVPVQFIKLEKKFLLSLVTSQKFSPDYFSSRTDDTTPTPRTPRCEILWTTLNPRRTSTHFHPSYLSLFVKSLENVYPE